MKQFLSELGREIWQVSYTLFRLMIPALIVVKILEELGAVAYLGVVLGPLMNWVGLPESMGLVWATTMATNIYAGMLVFFQLPEAESLTVAQITVLGTLMLMAHGLPVEARIAQQAGVRLRVTLVLRIGGGLLLGWLLHTLYGAGGWLQQANELAWQPAPVDDSWRGWLISQGESLLMIQLVIIVLLTGLKLLRLAGIERLMAWLLRPLLKLLGIGREATTITIVGVTLGLAFGGGLLIKEARAGHVSKRDIFAAMGLLALCHSVIEDTLLVMLLGADISGVLWLRLLFSVTVIAVMTRLIDRRSDQFWRKHLVNRHIEPPQPTAG
ncbi:nucleoside recognition domain-containing protein [Marinobacterium arenosum]|uniref:nucleoside recognition domain-containing protein n=1 Tax=Marinobacterium arenosum TaxID=2862496 RepID=UPI001C96B793|nr:nucleoside recognition domain-containing protein [Marinobacterium arenosum]MBY4678436.1 hypothetical protein [Marinobacterium arenosum]